MILRAPTGASIVQIVSIKLGAEELSGEHLTKADGEYPATHMFSPFEIELDGRVFQDTDDNLWLYRDLVEEDAIVSPEQIDAASDRAASLLCRDLLTLAAEQSPRSEIRDAIDRLIGALK